VSFEEKGTWVSGMVVAATYVAYLTVVLAGAGETPLPEVAYVPPMLWSIGLAVALSIIGYIAVAVTRPSEADKSDVRDRDISRFGDYVGGIVLAVTMLVPFGLALAAFDHFWIANAMYAAFVLASLVSQAVKIVVYRRGF
jgi:hypothetical protein